MQTNRKKKQTKHLSLMILSNSSMKISHKKKVFKKNEQGPKVAHDSPEQGNITIDRSQDVNITLYTTTVESPLRT